MSRLQSIQYLRALAACMVVLAHVLPNRIGLIGSSGVDIFFVISGFIMWGIAISKDAPPAAFIRDRVTRIVPLYWFYTLLLAAAVLLMPSAFARLEFSMPRLLASLAFLPQVDPVTGLRLPILAQGWTLNYEMFFYAIVALALSLPIRFRDVLIGLALFGFAIVGWFAGSDRPLWMTFCDPILIEFVAGMAIAVCWRKGWLPGRNWSLALLAIAVAGFVASAVFGEPSEKFRFLAWGGPSALLVIGLLSFETRGVLPKLKWAALIGDASYSIYLTHGLFFSVLAKIKSVVLGSAPSSLAATVALAGLMAAVCVIGGIIAYWAIETPLLQLSRKMTGRLFQPARSFVRGLKPST